MAKKLISEETLKSDCGVNIRPFLAQKVLKRNVMNGAIYILVTFKEFLEKLSVFRESNNRPSKIRILQFSLWIH